MAEGVNPSETEQLLLQFDAEFDQLCVEAAVNKGQSFLGEDTMGQVLAELIALSNSARYTFMKIRWLQYKLSKEGSQKLDLNLAKDFKKEM